MEEAAAALAGAERPVIMAGTGLYWAHGEGELQQLAEELGIPVFLNGMGRGCLPADHDLCFSRARGQGLKEADVAVVVGVPLDFRLGFGNSFGEETKLIWIDEAPNELTANRKPDFELVGGIGATLAALRVAAVSGGASRDRTRPGSSRCAQPRTKSAPARPTSSPTTAPRFTRCGSTASSPRCSTATRS